MATFRICVPKSYPRKDGKFRVAIRITQDRKSCYLSTDVYVSAKDMDSDFKQLKNDDIRRRIDTDIVKYQDMLLRGLGSNLSSHSCTELRDYIVRQVKTQGGATIDFIEFGRQFTDKLKKDGRKTYAESFDAILRSLIDFFGKEQIFIKEINRNNLQEFIKYLKTERKMTRVNQHGNKYEITRPPLKDQTIYDYIGDIRTIFNAACNEYNGDDDDTILIRHNPFRNLELKVSDEPEKRSLSVKELKKIIDYKGGKGREKLARDVFLLSFYFVGMNTADLFLADATAIKKGRITYNRKKVSSRRKDKGLLSIKIEKEAMSLVEQYTDPEKQKAFNFYKLYTTFRIFNANLNKGLKTLAENLEINSNLSIYYARHTWATIAENKCKISRADISFALNHVSGDGMGAKVTSKYITSDFTRIDKMNRKVLNYVWK